MVKMQDNLNDKSCWQKNKCVKGDLCWMHVHFLSVGCSKVEEQQDNSAKSQGFFYLVIGVDLLPYNTQTRATSSVKPIQSFYPQCVIYSTCHNCGIIPIYCTTMKHKKKEKKAKDHLPAQ